MEGEREETEKDSQIEREYERGREIKYFLTFLDILKRVRLHSF